MKQFTILFILSFQTIIQAQPQVIWLSPNPDELDGGTYFAPDAELNLKAIVTGISNPIESNFVVEVDGMPQTGGSRLGNTRLNRSTYTASAMLHSGKQVIRVGYKEGASTYWTKPLQVNYSAGRANLHVLVIGTAPPNLKYTDKDAEAIAKALQFQDNKNGLYGAVNIKPLIRDKATASNMKIELERLRTGYQLGHIKPQDMVLVYIATHGDVRANSFYLQGDDFEPAAPESTSLSYQEIVRAFSEIPCKKLLVLDACKSGYVRDGNAVNNAIRELSKNMNGTTIITSSQADQLSYEHDNWKHGAFTLAFLKALNGNADENNDTIITVNELYGYIKEQVPQMVLATLGHQQRPELTRNELGDLPLFKVVDEYQPPPPPVIDRDGDGVPDTSDSCPDDYGSALAYGCPDADEDGVPDNGDNCKYQKGERRFKGCPDTDKDGIPDYDDDCKDEPGPADRRGCPDKASDARKRLLIERLPDVELVRTALSDFKLDGKTATSAEEARKMLQWLGVKEPINSIWYSNHHQVWGILPTGLEIRIWTKTYEGDGPNCYGIRFQTSTLQNYISTNDTYLPLCK